MEPARQEIAIDTAASEICARILRQRFPPDLNVLELETGLLSLLSWAYTRGSQVKGISRSGSRLPLKNTIKVRRAADILRRCLENPPTIAELSKQAGLNASDLKRGFRHLYNTTPARYSRKTRMETARSLLTYTSLSIVNIALEMGFSNPSQFSRAFRQEFGVNPSDIRRNPEE